MNRKIPDHKPLISKKYLWAQTSVKRMLQNGLYMGTLVNHKTVTSKIYKTKTQVPDEERYRHEDFCKPIIDKQTWEQAQFLLEQRPKSNVRASGGRKIHRYCGLIKCEECGAILIAKRRKYSDGTEYVEYTCNSHHRYGKEYCTPHRVRESQLDSLVEDEIASLKENLSSEWQKYEKIIRDWTQKKPLYEQKIQRLNDKILTLQSQIEDLIMERIADREHAEIYNNMIQKREEEIENCRNQIADCKNYEQVSKKKQTQLKFTVDILDDIISSGSITNTQLRMLVNKVFIHQNEDKSIDVRFEFNGDFDSREVV